MPALKVHTHEFQFAHGKRPRGVGMWAFAHNSWTPADELYWFVGPYYFYLQEAARLLQDVV